MIPGDKACYPGTDTLINKYDIRDFAALRAVEYKFASARELQLGESPIKGKFDFAHLQAIHKHIFQDVYEWAGQPREVDFAKRNKDTGLVNRFIPCSVMDIKAEDFNKFIAEKNNLKGLTKPEFVKAITEVHTKLNELHPFREGNGRSTRIFLTQLAKEAGYDLDVTKMEKERWNLASHRALMQHHPKEPSKSLVPNQSDMRQIFHESCKPTIAHSFDHEPRAEAMKTHPGLRVVYNRLDAIQQHAAKMPDKDAGAKLLAAEKARISQKLHAGIPLGVAVQRDQQRGQDAGKSLSR